MGSGSQGYPQLRRSAQSEVLAPYMQESFQGPHTSRSGWKEGTLTRGDSGSHQTDDPATWRREFTSCDKVSPLPVLQVGRMVLATPITGEEIQLTRRDSRGSGQQWVRSWGEGCRASWEYKAG